MRPYEASPSSLVMRETAVRQHEKQQTLSIPASPPLLGPGLHVQHARPAHFTMLVQGKLDHERLVRLPVHSASLAFPKGDWWPCGMPGRPLRC
jgi:hypothetical protein